MRDLGLIEGSIRSWVKNTERKMKKFTCHYLDENGQWDDEFLNTKIETTSAEEAARIFAEQYPSENLRIGVSWGLAGHKILSNRERAQQLRLEEEDKRAQEEASRIADRVESLKELVSKVENTNGNLEDLSYADLTALIENMWDFPEIRDELSPEECVVREKLYKMAFFDRNLQAGLQAMTRFPPQSGKSPQSSPTRSSEVSEVVSCLEGIHFWVKFMGVVVLISIICSIVIFLLEGAAY